MVVLAGCQTGPQELFAQAEPRPSTPLPAALQQISAPPGFLSFCLRFRDQCAVNADPSETLALTGESWATLLHVNDAVNRSVRPLADAVHYGRPEYWTIATDGFGDCDDYAVTKRKALIEAGIPARALRLATVITRRDNRHVVLTVATDHGVYVLDNATAFVLPWVESGYEWTALQDANREWGWFAFSTPAPAPIVTAMQK
jgi:predicted transglutaminase-like cysteine proteinase